MSWLGLEGKVIIVTGGASGIGKACCESLAGRRDDALEHLRRAIELWDGARALAQGDSDFDPIRDEPAFQELLSR